MVVCTVEGGAGLNSVQPGVRVSGWPAELGHNSGRHPAAAEPGFPFAGAS